jgi:hypothetical protein
VNRPQSSGGVAGFCGSAFDRLGHRHFQGKAINCGNFARDAEHAKAVRPVGSDFRVDDRAMWTFFDAGNVRSCECQARG